MKTLSLSLVTSLLFILSQPVFAAGWKTDYEKALAEAKLEHKIVLLDFTGSDWCGWCMKLDKEVFSKPAFKQYAADNLILVEVDFPRAKHLTRKVQAQNAELKTKFGVTGYPTIVLLDEDGNKLGEQAGYLEGGPEAFIAMIESHKKPSGTPAAEATP